MSTKLEVELLPKVTYLPLELSNLIVDYWSGDIIHIMKGGSVIKAMNGRGKVVYTNGNVYEGDVKAGILHGKGEFRWKDGTLYKGRFEGNEISGKGRYDWTDGSSYEGSLLKGLRHGSGKYQNPNEGIVYEGQWKNGLRDGQGTLEYKSGAKYEGGWLEGLKSGKGKMSYASGNYYEGEWLRDLKNGKGLMVWASAHERYEGEWRDNMQWGFGTHLWEEERGHNKLLRNRYVGYWERGMRNKQGTFFYSNGSKYEGDWKDNLKHGYGVFTFEDGSHYKGPFDKDRMVNAALNKMSNPLVSLGNQSTVLSQEDLNASVRQTVEGTTRMQTGMVSAKHSTMSGNSPAKKKTPAVPKSHRSPGKSKAKGSREIEENPFKRLIDIEDLLQFEGNPAQVSKEVQNIMLRHITKLKKWFREYQAKFEAKKSEESFSMVIRQVWRFLRDCKVFNCRNTIAQFNRVYQAGRKNNFNLEVRQRQVQKFAELSMLSASRVEPNKSLLCEDGPSAIMDEVIHVTDDTEDKWLLSDDEMITFLEGDEPVDDIHTPNRPILERHFFEALPRAASILYENDPECKTLKEKLDKLFNQKLIPYACQRSCKTMEEDREFKRAGLVLKENKDTLVKAFQTISSVPIKPSFGKINKVVTVADLENMAKDLGFIKKAGRRFFRIIEKYYDPDATLDALINKGSTSEDIHKLRRDVDRHIEELRGCEVTFFEFLEIIVHLSLMSPGATKVRQGVQSFIVEKLLPWVQAKNKEVKVEVEAPKRKMISSWKDKQRAEVEERQKLKAAALQEERRKEAERIRIAEEEAKRAEQESAEKPTEEEIDSIPDQQKIESPAPDEGVNMRIYDDDDDELRTEDEY